IVKYADNTLNIYHSLIRYSDSSARIKATAHALGSAFTGADTSNINSPTAVNSGQRVTFKNCDIYCSPETGTHEVHGAIREKYHAVGGPNNALSLPVTDETATPDKLGRYNHFKGNGSIYW